MGLGIVVLPLRITPTLSFRDGGVSEVEARADPEAKLLNLLPSVGVSTAATIIGQDFVEIVIKVNGRNINLSDETLTKRCEQLQHDKGGQYSSTCRLIRRVGRLHCPQPVHSLSAAPRQCPVGEYAFEEPRETGPSRDDREPRTGHQRPRQRLGKARAAET
jgi:hypothetical protein